MDPDDGERDGEGREVSAAAEQSRPRIALALTQQHVDRGAEPRQGAEDLRRADQRSNAARGPRHGGALPGWLLPEADGEKERNRSRESGPEMRIEPNGHPTHIERRGESDNESGERARGRAVEAAGRPVGEEDDERGREDTRDSRVEDQRASASGSPGIRRRSGESNEVSQDEENGGQKDGRPEVERICGAVASLLDPEVPRIATHGVVIGEVDITVEGDGSDEDP